MRKWKSQREVPWTGYRWRPMPPWGLLVKKTDMIWSCIQILTHNIHGMMYTKTFVLAHSNIISGSVMLLFELTGVMEL
jgi:hypothetical protein